MKKTLLLLFSLIYASMMTAHDIQTFVSRQLETYPRSRLLDLYKSCFQDYMGAEHLVSDREQVKAYLYDELAAIRLDDLLPWLAEPCGPDGRYVRVSLRAVKEGLMSEDLLLDAFIRSANSASRPSVASWREHWHQLIAAIDAMSLTLPHYQADRAFIDSVLTAGRYAISHSPDYRDAYRPHYRIVERGIFEREIQPLLEGREIVVRIAEIEVYPQYLDDYLQAARHVGAESVKKEPGVVCIFPNQLKESPHLIRIVEIYRDKAAYEHHLTTDHFLTYKQGTLHMVKSLHLHDLIPLDREAMGLIFRKVDGGE